MQINGQNFNKITYGNGENRTPAAQTNPPQAQPQPQQQAQAPSCQQSPATAVNQPTAQTTVTNPQQPCQPCAQPAIQAPQVVVPGQPPLSSSSGVHIQIFNPCVATPGSSGPTYNVNSPCYPANYYTGDFSHTQPQNGNNGINGNNGANGANGANGQSTAVQQPEKKDNDKKTEKKDVVMLTDDYIRSLENSLNNPNKETRFTAAQQVYDRFKEDPDNKNDKALNALLNKMLQDPADEVRMCALAALNGRMASGDEKTVAILKNIQSSNSGYGQDAIDAGNILLNMAGKTVEKDVKIDPNRQPINTTKKDNK